MCIIKVFISQSLWCVLPATSGFQVQTRPDPEKSVAPIKGPTTVICVAKKGKSF